MPPEHLAAQGGQESRGSMNALIQTTKVYFSFLMMSKRAKPQFGDGNKESKPESKVPWEQSSRRHTLGFGCKEGLVAARQGKAGAGCAGSGAVNKEGRG